MTEAEWLRCNDPPRMLNYLRGKVGERKARLFAVCCCTSENATIDEPGCRHAVEISERYADGLEMRSVLKRARRGALVAVDLDMPGLDIAAWHTGERDAWAAAINTAEAIAGRISTDSYASHRETQTALLRDIFGNPYRPATFIPAWRTDTALSLARGMYESRDFSAMPILADALQDVDCDNTDILDHCRDPHATHVRGCWVVDLVLGKA